MEADELQLLNETLLGLAVSERNGLITKALDAFGWRDMLATHPEEAIAALFDAQGRTGTWSAALHDVLAIDAQTFGMTGPINVLLPRPGSSWPGALRDEKVAIDGILLAPRTETATLVIALLTADREGLLVAVEPDDLLIERRQGLDPALGVYAVSGTTVRRAILVEGERAREWWKAAQSRARLALCRQMVAALTVMIEQARSHVSERVQFGRLVGTFQAVRHKLVEAHVATTAADCATSTAWESDDLDLAALTAKVVTGKAVGVTAANAQQLLAGLGFTTEHPFHRFMKRAIVLERILGSGNELASVLGRRLVERGEAPRLVQL
jgi:Acyl-CoA dehydrogenase, C-terminal domain